MTYSPNASNPVSSKSTAHQGQNNTGTNIPKTIPVKVTSTGINIINPSTEADVDGFSGLTGNSTNNGEMATVITAGTILECGLSFAIGSVIYVSKSGGITDVKPSIGVGGFVAGDFVIRLGVITANELNPALRDALVAIQFMGQL